MPIVTLTTDFGLKDYYVGSLKGAIYSQSPDINVIDISHNVPIFDIVRGAYIIKNAYRNFPESSIHIIAIHNYYQSNPIFIAAAYDGHYFIAPDNGILSLLMDKPTKDLYEIENEGDTLNVNNIMSKAVWHIQSERPFTEIGYLVDSIDEKITIQPTSNSNQIKGTVIHIDHYENVILNINKDLFNNTRENRDFELYYRRNNPIRKLAKFYSDVEVGEALCLINAAGYLEIAINMGKAASMLGLKVDDTVQIDF